MGFNWLVIAQDMIDGEDAKENNKVLLAKIKQLEEAYKTCAKSEDVLLEENQRLKDDIVKLQAKQFKDLAEIALKWEQKNQRLRETVERLIDDGGLSEHLRRILQKALKGK